MSQPANVPTCTFCTCEGKAEFFSEPEQTTLIVRRRRPGPALSICRTCMDAIDQLAHEVAVALIAQLKVGRPNRPQ